MGIQGLLPFLKKSSRISNLAEFKGQTVAVDAYCWLHKGAFACADKLVKGEPTDGYVVYVMKQVNMLLSFNIKPILVFDGCHLPSKSGTEKKRHENRARNRQKAKELLREGKIKEARECFQRCVDVTPAMALDVVKACRAKNVDTIVAPYEADAQLAFLSHSGIADVIITEDSDLVIFGCNKILFKMDSNGGGILIEKENLHLSMNIPRDKFSFEKFRNMCVLSGCDYLPSLHGIGLVKACRFFNVTSNPDVFTALTKLPSHLKMPNLHVSLEYREGFVRAINAVLHQLVFDPSTKTLRPLTPYPPNINSSDMPYCGEFLGHEKALQIALGNMDIQTFDLVDDFRPQNVLHPAVKSSGWSSRVESAPSYSIWQSNYLSIKKNPSEEANENEKAKMVGKEQCVAFNLGKRKRPEPVLKLEEVSEDYLECLYSKNASKKIKGDLEELIEEVESPLTTPQKAIQAETEENSLEKCDGVKKENLSDSFSENVDPGKSLNPFAKETTTSYISNQIYSVSPKFCKEPNMDEEVNLLAELNGNREVKLNNFFSDNEGSTPHAERKAELLKTLNPFAKKTAPSSVTKIVRSRYFTFNGSKDWVKLIKDRENDVDGVKEATAEKVSPAQGKCLEEISKSKLLHEINRLSPAAPLDPEFAQPLSYESKLLNSGSVEEIGPVLVPKSSTESSIFDTPPSSQNKENLTTLFSKLEYSLDKGSPFSSDRKVFDTSLRADRSLQATESHKVFSTPNRSLFLASTKSLPNQVLSDKCRVSGLRKTNSPANKQKQLNLKDMFAFKKDVMAFK